MSGSFYPGPWSAGHAFEKAEKYLAAGKSKTDRPIGSNTRLRRIDEDTIAVVLHSTAVVTYHRDATMTIFGGGWNTVTTKDRISSYSPCRPSSDGNGSWIVGQTGETTPARVQKCRTCKGRGRWQDPEECWGPSWIYGNGAPHREETCKHGQTSSHATGAMVDRECYRCKGEGRADYGSKPIPVLATAGVAFKVDSEGKFLGNLDPYFEPKTYGPSTKYSAPKASKYPETYYAPAMPSYAQTTPSYSMGGEVADKLATVMPGLDAMVKHPVTGGQSRVRLIVVDLNDSFGWTREAIADWLETLDVDLKFPVAS